MEKIKAILFDLDNTLLDRTSTFHHFTEQFLENYFGHVESTQDMHDRIVELDQDGYKNKEELFKELLQELPWQTKPEVAELMDFYSREYVRSAVLMDQAREVVGHARTKYRTGLITNGRTLIQYGKIDQLGIRGDFDTILVSEEAGCKKPDPRMVHEKIGQMIEAVFHKIANHAKMREELEAMRSLRLRNWCVAAGYMRKMAGTIA